MSKTRTSLLLLADVKGKPARRDFISALASEGQTGLVNDLRLLRKEKGHLLLCYFEVLATKCAPHLTLPYRFRHPPQELAPAKKSRCRLKNITNRQPSSRALDMRAQ